jgi:hypothetical protein
MLTIADDLAGATKYTAQYGRMQQSDVNMAFVVITILHSLSVLF